MSPSLDSGGLQITNYYLEIAPKTTMIWTDVTTYPTNSFLMTHILTDIDDGLDFGEIYFFRWRS